MTGQLWARVRDLSTGHHFDVGLDRLQQLIEAGAAEELPPVQHARHTGKPCHAKPRRPIPAPVAPPSKAAKTAPAAKAVADKNGE